MRNSERWFLTVFLGITLAAAAFAAGCGNEPANPALLTSADSLDGDSIPPDTTPPDTMPRDTIPRDTIPRDTIPRDTIPRDTIPRDTIPGDSTPPAPSPTSITVSPRSQERAVGDSGVVSAVVRDSAGREIWPVAITWDLRDTSTVLRIRVRGTSYVVFDAVAPGQARLIAQHAALADTALVVVR